MDSSQSAKPLMATTDASYQRFRAAMLTPVDPWAVWADETHAGPIYISIPKEIHADHWERQVFMGIERHRLLSIALAEALLVDAEERLTTLDLSRYSRTVGARTVTAYTAMARKLRKQLAIHLTTNSGARDGL
jgi:hypothetical protein